MNHNLQLIRAALQSRRLELPTAGAALSEEKSSGHGVMDCRRVTHIAGVDGCKAGWIAVCFPKDRPDRAEAKIFPTFAALLKALPEHSIIAVDIPIGLPERAINGGREPDWAARKFLGARQACVFPVPSRSAVYAFEQGYIEVCAMARKTSDPPKTPSKQAFWIFPRIQDVDKCLRQDPRLPGRVFEVHPEVAFSIMNGGQSLEPKKVKGRGHVPGLLTRKALLEARGFPVSALEQACPRGAAQDDLFDACACAWSAHRIAKGEARVFPDKPKVDAEGLPVAIWA